VILPKILARLPNRFRWTAHNIIAHPLSELLFQIGVRESIYNYIHDVTVPNHTDGTGRG